MNFDEIMKALRGKKLDATAEAFERAIDEEARALAELPGGKWKKRDGGKFARGAAREFYARDITTQLADPSQPTPDRLLSHRRFAVVWAVAEVLRTNGLGGATPGAFEDAAKNAAEHGDYKRAAELYDSAAGASIGRSRAEWYERAADDMRAKAREAGGAS